jgi:uncharacterized protein (TIGR02594 family)
MLQQGSRGEAVVRLQRALNVAQGRIPPLRPDGGFGALSKGAVQEFQTQHRLEPDGKVPPAMMEHIASQAVALGWIERPAPGGPAPWLDIARGEIGQSERPGLDANPRILAYIATFPALAGVPHPRQGVPMTATDETAWCACFVNWCLIRAGQRHHASALARDWLDYGQPLDQPAPGAICVIHNPNLPSSTTASGWHVGFWTGAAPRGVKMLGGNQGNAVTDTFMPGEVRGYRWPA